MRNLHHFLCSALLLSTLLLLPQLGQLMAQDQNRNLISQVLQDSEGQLPAQTILTKMDDWRDLKVMKVRKLGAEDGRGTFMYLYELDLSGNLTRFETASGDQAHNFYYNDKNALISIESFNKGVLAWQRHYYYDASGKLYKGAEMELTAKKEIEVLYDDQANPETKVVYTDGLVSDSWKITNTYDNGRLISRESKGNTETFSYNSKGQLLSYASTSGPRGFKTDVSYKNDQPKEAKRYNAEGEDFTLQATVAFKYNSLGLVQKETVKYRDANSMPVSYDYIYDQYWEVISSSRGDLEEDGFPGYGTPLVLSWMSPMSNVDVTDSTYDIRIEVKPGPGQEMPDIKGITLRHNGEFSRKDVGDVFLEQAGKGNKWTFEKRMYLTEGMNTIDVEATTGLGSFYSGQRHVNYVNPRKPIKVDNLYVLAIGIADYDLDNYDLDFADKDARDLAGMFDGQQGKLYDNVKIQLITNKDATKENIEKSIRKLRGKVTDRDLSIVLFSGHGVTTDADEYYLLPRCEEKCDGPLEKTAISNRWMMEQVGRWGGPMIYFFDGCHTSPTDTNGNPIAKTNLNLVEQNFSEYVTKKNNLKILMMASQAEKQSKENGWWQNGAFTEALMEGLSGKADEMGDNNGMVTFSELNEYTTWRVNKLTDGQQVPYALQRGVGEVSMFVTEKKK